YNTVTGYGDDHVLVNGERYDSSLIVMPDKVLSWDATAFDSLSDKSFAYLLELGVEIVLLGTGPRQRFPHPRLSSPLAAAGVGLEVMDLKAACRTSDILAAEERKVALALRFK